MVSEKAFCRIQEDTLRRAKELVDACREVIVTVDIHAAGDFNREAAALYEYAAAQGKIEQQ